MRNLIGILVIFSFYSILLSCNLENQSQNNSLLTYATNEYVGETTCISCHQREYNEWQGSHHDWAMKLPNDSTVLGNFNNVSFMADGDSYYFRKNDSSYFVNTAIGGKTEEYEIAYTFGVTPLQQYLIKFPDGKYQTLRATWDVKKKEWYHQYKGQQIPQNDWLHWTGGGQRWNTMCAECHSTNLQKNYNLQKDAFSTSYDNITVSCEACHGPGGAHLNWASSPKPIGNPQLKSVGKDQITQLNQCSGCHARRVKLTKVMKAGESFDNQFMLQTITSEYYHADGQIKEEDYVFGSFVQSKMYSNKVKCSDCHNVHSMRLKLEGNALCMQCHKPKYDSEVHHFHEVDTESAQCISCHMTGSVYMGNDFRRDHSFRIPRPDQSLQYGTPNACIGCHEDKSNKWAADQIVSWYGNQRADHFSDYLLKASRPPYDEPTKKTLIDFINNLIYPAIARATALEYYPWTGDEEEFAMLFATLTDSSALVRYKALMKLQPYPLEQRLSFATEHLMDSILVVRIGAAQLMIDKDINQMAPAERGVASKARQELVRMLRANADFPLGRLQLGDYYFHQNNTQRALNEYEMALKMDSLLIPAYTNLATAYSITGDNAKALETLDKLLLLQGEFARGYYLRGLLQHEIGEDLLAIEDLEKAIYYDPQNFRAYYNLANLYLSVGEVNRAEETIISGLQLQPDSEDGKYLLSVIKLKADNK